MVQGGMVYTIQQSKCCEYWGWWWWDELGDWDRHIYTKMSKIDN